MEFSILASSYIVNSACLGFILFCYQIVINLVMNSSFMFYPLHCLHMSLHILLDQTLQTSGLLQTTYSNVQIYSTGALEIFMLYAELV